MQKQISSTDYPSLTPTQSAESAHFQLSLITASSGNATKRIIADSNGQPIKDTRHSLGIYGGNVQALELHGLVGLQSLLNRVQHNQALVHGIPKGHTQQNYQLVTAKHYRGKPGQIARTKKCFAYPDTKLLMLDVDPEPTAPYEPVSTPQDLINRITAVMPELAGMGWLATRSTSSAIRSKATGEWLKPPSGMHLYFLARGDVDQFVKTLKVRLWRAGLGFCKLATPNQKTGVAAVLERAIVDMTVFSPERLDYVAGAEIPNDAPFFQDRPEPILQPGAVVELDSIPKPTPAERRDYCQRVADAKRALQPEREHIIAERVRVEKPAADTATIKRHVKQRLKQAEAGELEPDHKLYLKDGRVLAFGDLTAADDGVTLFDPLEGRSYQCTAYFHWNAGYPFIISLAHGIKTRYRLKITHAVRQARAADFCQQAVTAIQRDKPRLVALRASHGIGKTQHIIKPIVADSQRAVVIGHRIALMRDTANRLALDNYQDIKSADFAAAVDKLALCINSLIKPCLQTAPALQAPDVVVIDEFEQVKAGLAIDPNMKTTAPAIYDRLMQLLASAEQIILSDADLNAETVAFFEVLLNCDATWYTYEPPKPNIKITVIDYDAGITRLQDALATGRALVGSDSKKAIGQLQAAIPDNKRTLLVSDDTKGTSAVKDFLADPAAGITKLDCLLYSPSIGSGVSFETPHFDKHFLIYSGVVSATDALQMAMRDRTATDIIVLIRNVKTDDSLETEPEKIIVSMELRKRADRGRGFQFNISDFDTMTALHIAQRNAVMRNPKASLLALCKQRGFTVAIDDKTPKNKAAVKLLTTIHTAKKEQAIQDAAPLDPVTAAGIETGKRAKTPELAAQLERYRITEAFRLEPDALIEKEIFERWDDGRGLATLKRADNAFGSESAVEARSRSELKYTVSKQKNPTLERRVFRRLLHYLNIDVNTGCGEFTYQDALTAWREFNQWRDVAEGISVPRKEPKYPARWASEQLAKLGLETSSRQSRSNGRKRVYQIKPDSWQFVTDLVQRREREVSHMPSKYIYNTSMCDTAQGAAA